MSTDKSRHETVVEYAAQTMIKRGKSPRAAAEDTAKKLSGSENIFLGPGVVAIDPTELEAALWGRLVEFTVRAMRNIRPGFEHFALDGTVQHFRQKPAFRKQLKARIVAALRVDPFGNDDGP